MNFRIDDELLTALDRIRDRDGVPVSEQVRRGIQMWLKSKGIKSGRKRAVTRKRP
jgi:hypothetical protein